MSGDDARGGRRSAVRRRDAAGEPVPRGAFVPAAVDAAAACPVDGYAGFGARAVTAAPTVLYSPGLPATEPEPCVPHGDMISG